MSGSISTRSISRNATPVPTLASSKRLILKVGMRNSREGVKTVNETLTRAFSIHSFKKTAHLECVACKLQSTFNVRRAEVLTSCQA